MKKIINKILLKHQDKILPFIKYFMDLLVLEKNDLKQIVKQSFYNYSAMLLENDENNFSQNFKAEIYSSKSDQPFYKLIKTIKINNNKSRKYFNSYLTTELKCAHTLNDFPFIYLENVEGTLISIKILIDEPLISQQPEKIISETILE